MKKEIFKKEKELVLNLLKVNVKKNIVNVILSIKNVKIFVNVLVVKIDHFIIYHFFAIHHLFSFINIMHRIKFFFFFKLTCLLSLIFIHL
jgi:hypothetical protein